jgi:poly(A) polymerase
LWPALPARVLRLQERGMPPIPAMQEAAHELIAEQCQRIAIPKRFTMPIREIWDMQERLPRRSGKRADLLLDNPRFRAGYDFLLLRCASGEIDADIGDWWTAFYEGDEITREELIASASAPREGGGGGGGSSGSGGSGTGGAAKRKRGPRRGGRSRGGRGGDGGDSGNADAPAPARDGGVE